eukprot:Anaeramoba_ignava/c20423_g1_i1.p2 GENE.c20423_g1_i1~~c20423_g1_i1.p2  ORF type:complete len:341 (-),score=114.00 c20423_g1_i1:2148-3137(-)
MNEQGLTIGNLTTICVQNAFNDLDKLVYQTPDDEYAKKVELCEYFESQRRKFAKLLVIIKWARKYSKLSLKAQKLTEIVEDKSFLFTNTADNLVDVYNLQNFQKFSTNFDIINSSKIFFGGNFESLPKSSLFMIQEKLDEEQIKWGEYNLKLQMFIKLIGCEAFRSFTKSMYSKGFLYCLYQNKFVLKLTLHKDIMMKNNEPDDPNMKNRNLDILTGNCFWFIDGLVLLPKEKGIFIDENTDLVDFFNCILITENELNLQHLLQFKLSQMQLDSADLENEQFSQNSDEDENAKNNNLKLKLSTSSKKKGDRNDNHQTQKRNEGKITDTT